MPDCVAVALYSPLDTLIHTGDFKFDQTAIDGVPTDTDRLAELGRTGVLVLFSDSTNIERQGHTGSELDVVKAFEEIFSNTKGELLVTTFASSLHRIQILIDLAARFDRKVVFVGRGMIQTTAIATQLCHIRIPAGLQIRESDIGLHRPKDVLCIMTGSQGESLSALSRIAIDDHQHTSLEPNDVVVFSARAIPGNQRAIGRLMDQIAKRGVEVIHENTKLVHVSGHGSAEELKLMLSLVSPRFFVPIHGEYRYLASHARVADSATDGHTMVLLAENGDRIGFDTSGGWIGGKAPGGRVLIDGNRTGEVTEEALRDRRHLARDGLIVLVVLIDRQAGTVKGKPELITRGFAVDELTEGLLAEVPGLVGNVFGSASIRERIDHELIEEQLRIELQRFFRKRLGRRPLVLPVIKEI